MYVGDAKSRCSTWTIYETLPGRDVKLIGLFTAGGHCFGTHYNRDISDEKQGIGRYNVIEQTWVNVCALPSHCELQSYGIVGSGDHVCIVGGGDRSGGKVYDTVLVYDIRSGRLCRSAELKLKRKNCSCVTIGNTLYIGGGWDGGTHFNTVEAMSLSDPKSHYVTFTQTYNCSLAAVGEKLVATGGTSGIKFNSEISSAASMFDLLNESWLSLPPMNDDRLYHGTCSLADGTVVALGGDCNSKSSCRNTVEGYSIAGCTEV